MWEHQGMNLYAYYTHLPHPLKVTTPILSHQWNVKGSIQMHGVQNSLATCWMLETAVKWRFNYREKKPSIYIIFITQHIATTSSLQHAVRNSQLHSFRLRLTSSFTNHAFGVYRLHWFLKGLDLQAHNIEPFIGYITSISSCVGNGEYIEGLNLCQCPPDSV